MNAAAVTDREGRGAPPTSATVGGVGRCEDEAVGGGIQGIPVIRRLSAFSIGASAHVQTQ